MKPPYKQRDKRGADAQRGKRPALPNTGCAGGEGGGSNEHIAAPAIEVEPSHPQPTTHPHMSGHDRARGARMELMNGDSPCGCMELVAISLPMKNIMYIEHTNMDMDKHL